MQSMMSLQSCWDWANFESNYRSVFLPPGPPSAPPTPGAPSLLKICLTKVCTASQNNYPIFSQVVSDSSLAVACRSSLPRSLVLRLGEVAAQGQRCASLAALMEAWPQPCLSLAQLSPNKCMNFSEELDVEDKKQTVLGGKEMAVTLLGRLVKLAQSGRLPVEALDLTGFPLASGHLMDVLRSFAEAGNAGERPPLTLKVDLYLTDQECWRLNRQGTLRACGVRVLVRHVYFTIVSYGCNYSWQTEYLSLLKKMRTAWAHVFNTTQTTGLELGRLNIRSFFAENATTVVRNQGIEFFSTLADSFGQITTLDLSYNAINLNGSLSTSLILCDFLGKLRSLTRLDLSGNRLTNSLPVLLSHTPQLLYLNVTGTQLRTGDISYLSQVTSLLHLDLSSCGLSNKLNALLGVFGALTGLQILEMVDCSLEQLHMEELMPGLRKLVDLQVLNITSNMVEQVELPCKVVIDKEEEFEDEMYWQ